VSAWGPSEFVEKRAEAPSEAQPDVYLSIELPKELNLSRPQICFSINSKNNGPAAGKKRIAGIVAGM
jgi:hypothetical protein